MTIRKRIGRDAARRARRRRPPSTSSGAAWRSGDAKGRTSIARARPVVGRILHLQEPILRAVNAGLAAHGLRYADYAVLATLRVAGEPFRMSPSRLAGDHAVHFGRRLQSAATRREEGLCAPLGRSGGRARHPCRATEKGFALAEAAMADHAAVERRLCAMLSARGAGPVGDPAQPDDPAQRRRGLQPGGRRGGRPPAERKSAGGESEAGGIHAHHDDELAGLVGHANLAAGLAYVPGEFGGLANMRCDASTSADG